ncbi:hypothetical protein [Sulfuricurvum sp.]|uniref:hypothetical protein n=1 Tax=Sulfuricurvum sp. TaxID=2025608 RepID=UPI00262F41B0|nr:hypothetical protein [Sulfuricurvum sp.]MDD2781518.1 hypothetical protein [Sulfuricurvum sp.]
MFKDEIYFFVLIALITIVCIVVVFWLYRWTIRKNRIESIHEQKELLNADNSSSKTK